VAFTWDKPPPLLAPCTSLHQQHSFGRKSIGGYASEGTELLVANVRRCGKPTGVSTWLYHLIRKGPLSPCRPSTGEEPRFALGFTPD
jgi:hypothetical protein